MAYVDLENNVPLDIKRRRHAVAWSALGKWHWRARHSRQWTNRLLAVSLRREIN